MTRLRLQQKSVSRKLPAGDKRRGLQVHTRLVGQVIWAWNDLHGAYAFAFVQALDSSRGWIGHAIWTSLSNDAAQRDILSSILAFSDRPAVSSRLQWALDETRKLTVYRNDIVHGIMGWRLEPNGSTPTFSAFGNSLGRILRYVDRESHSGEILEGPDKRKLMLLLRGDLMQLAKYVLELGRALSKDRPSPLPRKPRLLARKFALKAEIEARRPKRRHVHGGRQPSP